MATVMYSKLYVIYEFLMIKWSRSWESHVLYLKFHVCSLTFFSNSLFQVHINLHLTLLTKPLVLSISLWTPSQSGVIFVCREQCFLLCLYHIRCMSVIFPSDATFLFDKTNKDIRCAILELVSPFRVRKMKMFWHFLFVYYGDEF